ncbi:unnamed protein product [Pleuronectes platessa]|uniref:Uncharacterized protein n=1 Tax=Pleuronectes platessa TaxID=8262 RepID=A0A9N7VX38_PLEPL|nr:unnamed protein product [Pleuronectes platessa]
MRRYQEVSVLARPGYLCQSFVMLITRPPHQRFEDSEPRAILQLGQTQAQGNGQPACDSVERQANTGPGVANISRPCLHGNIWPCQARWALRLSACLTKDRAINQAEIAVTRHGLMK